MEVATIVPRRTNMVQHVRVAADLLDPCKRTGLGQNVRRVWEGTLYTSGSHIHDRGSIIPHQVGGPAHGNENRVEKDKNSEEWWPWKLDPRNGHCATPSQWSWRKSREISGIVTENTRF